MQAPTLSVANIRNCRLEALSSDKIGLRTLGEAKAKPRNFVKTLTLNSNAQLRVQKLAPMTQGGYHQPRAQTEAASERV